MRDGTPGKLPRSAETVEHAYPYVARWVKDHGWIEIGYDDYSHSFIRALDIGGMFWEGERSYPSLDDALRAADAAIHDWLRENMGEK